MKTGSRISGFRFFCRMNGENFVWKMILFLSSLYKIYNMRNDGINYLIISILVKELLKINNFIMLKNIIFAVKYT